MNGEELRAKQKPLKDRYREDPSAAMLVLRAEGTVDPDKLTCRIERNSTDAGLHPATGGSGEWACSGDMLLEALVACAGVTLAAVATALEIPLRGGNVKAEGDLDFRGTLGVDRETPVGFQTIRLSFELDADATDDQLSKLLRLTERYCVIFQTLHRPPKMKAMIQATSG